jgi:hypothetical protein
MTESEIWSRHTHVCATVRKNASPSSGTYNYGIVVWNLITRALWLNFLFIQYNTDSWKSLKYNWIQQQYYPDGVFSTLTEVFLPWLRFFYPDCSFITWLKFSYPDRCFPTLTEGFLPWLMFSYPDWCFPTLTDVFQPWLMFSYPEWCFSTLTDVFQPWLMFSYPDWGFSTLTEVFLPDRGFSVLFPQLYGKCQGITRKDGARPALFRIG